MNSPCRSNDRYTGVSAYALQALFANEAPKGMIIPHKFQLGGQPDWSESESLRNRIRIS